MASWILSLLSFFWPSLSHNDLSASKRLVNPLPIQPSTRYFTFALQDPQHPNSVLYILCTLILSEQSAFGAQDLINAVKPGAVVAQVGSDALEVTKMVQLQHDANLYPKSLLHVIKESFRDGNTHSKYMKLALADVIKAIFGTTFMGHVVAARHAAKKLNSAFYYLECPLFPAYNTETEQSRDDNEDTFTAAKHVASALGSSLFSILGARPCKVSVDSLGLDFITSQVSSSLNIALSAYPTSSKFSAQGQSDGHDPEMEYKCPEFAQVFYPYLCGFYNEYRHLPGMSLALQETQKLLVNVEKGEEVDHAQLSICQCFRLAAEALRVVINGSAQAPLKMDKVSSHNLLYDELPFEDRCYVALAQALKQQLQKSQCVVAILDADMVAGIRKYWRFPVPDHVAAMAMECLVSDSDEDSRIEEEGSKVRILDKPIIVVGAGAAAAVGVASFSKWAPATVMKILSFKMPTVFKLALLQAKKGAVSAMAKAASPLMNSFVPSGKGFLVAKSAAGSKASVLKALANTGNIRTAAHSVISTAEKASFSAIRTAFYNAMQNRHRKGVGGRLWLSFGASVAACGGLLAFGEGIENVIEVIPQAVSISKLCQGVNNLSKASNALIELEDKQYWQAMYSRLYRQLTHSM